MRKKLVLACVLALAATSLAASPARAAAPPPETVQMQRQALGFWKAWDCLFAVAAFGVGNAIIIVKIRKAGGVVKFAKRLWKARDAEQRLKVVASVIGYVTGSGVMVRACTP